jgi:hypothetical protein
VYKQHYHLHQHNFDSDDELNESVVTFNETPRNHKKETYLKATRLLHQKSLILDIPYVETSAQSGAGVDECFGVIAKHAYENAP